MECLDVSFKLIKETIVYTALPLTHIINISFQSGIFPDAMKLAKVFPLFKTGDNGSFSKYRNNYFHNSQKLLKICLTNDLIRS